MIAILVALVVAWLALFAFTWSLCRAAGLADQRTEHELLQAALHGTDAAPDAAADGLAPGSSAPRVVSLTHYTRERRGR